MIYTVLTWLIMVISVFLVIVVLVQNSKGGGITNNFSSSQQLFGVRKTTDFLEKATWTLAAALILFSFACAGTMPSANQVNRSSELEELLRNQNAARQQTEAPAFPAPAAESESAAPAAEQPAE